MKRAGVQIREKRESKGWSQSRLASEVGTSQQTVAKIENDLIQHTRHLPNIARVLEIPLADLNDQFAALGLEQPRNLQLPIYASIPMPGKQIFNPFPVYYLPTPYPLYDIEDSFGLVLATGGVKPMADTGDIVLCGAHFKEKRGPSVLLSRPDSKQHDQKNVLVCYEIIEFEDKYVCGRHDPAGSVIVDQQDFPQVFKIYGVFFQR